MYSSDERAQVRERLVGRAMADSRFAGVALCGSGAVAREDAWSDIDLVFGVAADADFSQTIADWTSEMYAQFDALHHVETVAGTAVYRAFLLPDTLQVDLNFVPSSNFRAHGPRFRLLAGSAREPAPSAAAPTPGHLAGMGWLYAEQARACIGRGRLWQAERMLAALRDQALALACLRHGLPAVHGVGIDALPSSVLATYADCVVGTIEPGELDRAFRATVARLLTELEALDHDLHARVAATVLRLALMPQPGLPADAS